MVHPDAVLVFAYNIQQVLKTGNAPKALGIIDAMVEILEKDKKRMENSKTYKIKEVGPTIEYASLVEKVNEIIQDRNRKA